ncbi:hypothetical protein VTJ49DRAFT_4853 [Mycothermus thermophilus]|uniref:Amidase domain-containing protein n=1 Tax=Humicola insolens TaxID=85995 RepID=A0ABR3VLB8_HUMIN
MRGNLEGRRSIALPRSASKRHWKKKADDKPHWEEKADDRPEWNEKADDKPEWQEKAEAKRRKDLEKIPSEWILPQAYLDEAQRQRSIADGFIDNLLKPSERELTNLDIPTLTERIERSSLSAVELVSAYCKRAAYAHQLNKTLLEIGFDRALERAQELDAFKRTHGRTVGPLHGLPVTMKDQFHVKGMGTTMGYVGWIDTFEGDKYSKRKYRAESELVRYLESLGAVIIAKVPQPDLPYNSGTVLVGGSVSMPAAFSGVFSIKPSTGRLSTLGMANSSPGQAIIPTVPGLLSPDIASLRYAMEALLSNEPWLKDPTLLPIPWRSPSDVESGMKLSFGFMDFDGVVRPHPPITRALHLAKNALMAMGHEVVIPWKGPSLAEAGDIHAFVTGSNGNYDIFEQLKLSGEPLIPELRQDFPTGGRPVDAIILPVIPSAAVRPGKLCHYDYITLANVLDHPTMVIPVTRADKSIDQPVLNYVPVGEKDAKTWEDCSYDPKVYHGAPAAIQLLGGLLQEERLLAIGQVVVNALDVQKGQKAAA